MLLNQSLKLGKNYEQRACEITLYIFMRELIFRIGTLFIPNGST